MMKIGNRMFDVEHDCSVMGILNVTPDSFSDGGYRKGKKTYSRYDCRGRVYY